MKPGKWDMPTIWRGSTWGGITLQWLDGDGNPFDLTGWTAYAKSKQIDFAPLIVDPVQGLTLLSLTKVQTSTLNLGTEYYDWIWTKPNPPGPDIVTDPFLAGTVQIKEPNTKLPVLQVGTP